MLEKALKITKFNCKLSTAKSDANHVPECHICIYLNISRVSDSTASLGTLLLHLTALSNA